MKFTSSILNLQVAVSYYGDRIQNTLLLGYIYLHIMRPKPSKVSLLKVSNLS